jgi:hypothetical protein
VFRRLFWLCIGAGVGFGSSVWIQRRLREAVARYAPERLSADVTASVKELGADVRLAVATGRQAMRERETELRADVERTRA